MQRAKHRALDEAKVVPTEMGAQGIKDERMIS